MNDEHDNAADDRAMLARLTYTRDQVSAALHAGTDLVDTIADATELPALIDATLGSLGTGPFTRDEVTDALNDAANRITEEENPDGGETSNTIWTDDVLNLAVNAVGHVLDHPGASLFDVIAAAHADTELSASEEDDLPEGTVKGSEAWNEALYRTVTWWIS